MHSCFPNYLGGFAHSSVCILLFISLILPYFILDIHINFFFKNESFLLLFQILIYSLKISDIIICLLTKILHMFKQSGCLIFKIFTH